MRDLYTVEQIGNFYYIYYCEHLIVKTNCKEKIESFIQKDINERNSEGNE